MADVRYASRRGEIFIFFSHQWLGWSEPDPEHIHVAAMQMAEALDVISGEFTCCRLGHPNEDPCDREQLMLPLLGLYANVYAERQSRPAAPARHFPPPPSF